jgi:hypothetical protein
MTTAVSPIEAEVAAVIGDDAAAALAAAFCGRPLYVPRQPDADHAVSLAIGHEKALLLGSYFYRTKLEFPVGAAKRAAIRAMKVQGLGNREIAARLLVTDRFVRMVIAEAADADADWQTGLFGNAR